MKLRNYQEAAVAAIFNEWEEHDSTLLVLPTGTGKTVVFSKVIERVLERVKPRRALVLAHRVELIAQATRHLQRCGLEVAIEAAELYAAASLLPDAPVVASMVQTQLAGNGGRGRMTTFDPADFELVVCDEAHRYTAPSYRRVLNHYRQNSNVKILGATATADRADEMALGQVFESVAYDYEINEAIADGWLVPIEQQMVTIKGLDFSQIRTTRGDLHGSELAAVMEQERNLQGVVSASLEIIGLRPTIVFTASVRQAEMCAEIFNRHRPRMADWICGHTPKAQRFEIFEQFKRGQTQVLVNCGILTEGVDIPRIAVIVQARPTKSRCLYSQMIGRATRPIAGLVDNFDTPERRRAAIAASIKPACLVIDFAGNSGKHKLISTADVLGGKVSEEAIARVAARARQEGKPLEVAGALAEEELNVQAEIKARKEREAERRAHLIGTASYATRLVDPFDLFDVAPVRVRGWDRGKQFSPKQLELLRRQGLNPDTLDYANGKRLIGELIRRFDQNLCSLKQAQLLARYGYETKDLTRKTASELIDALKQNGWRKPAA